MKILFFVITITLSTMCFANWNPADEDLENCYWRDGRKMSEKNCKEFRDEVVREKLKPTKQMDEERAAAAIQYRENQIKWEQAKQAEKEQQKERNKQLEREFAEEQALAKKNHDTFQREQAREEAAHKRRCGKDYMVLRVGMKIARLEECYGAVYVTKTVGKGGVVATYRTMFDWVHVQNGRVISYTERTDN